MGIVLFVVLPVSTAATRHQATKTQTCAITHKEDSLEIAPDSLGHSTYILMIK